MPCSDHHYTRQFYFFGTYFPDEETLNCWVARLNVWEGEDRSNEGMNFVMVFPKETTTLPIKTISLDDFCTEQGISRIDLLKLDIQGNEAEILAGARCCFQKAE
jgi:FkbM family methyltransferase